MGVATYSKEDLELAVRTSQNISQVLRKLGLKTAGGSISHMVGKIRRLGLDTSHFTRKGIGRKRDRETYTCRGCGTEVPLKMYDRPKGYCSQECLRQGKSQNIRDALSGEEVRARISKKTQQSWGSEEGRGRRLAAMQRPEVRERRAKSMARASQEPSLRSKRSVNALKKWNENPEYRAKFQQASKESRRRRALTETCPKKPHIRCESKAGTILVRSKWERDFAIWLDLMGVRWEYEPLRVVVEGRPYTPDFSVWSPFGKCYIEIHRVCTARSGDTKLEKMNNARSSLDAPLILISEVGVASVRSQIRCMTTHGKIRRP